MCLIYYNIKRRKKLDKMEMCMWDLSYCDDLFCVDILFGGEIVIVDEDVICWLVYMGIDGILSF